ncbi:hypothetical protein Cob_v004462 [Colletotrichum orbiculare MAFF 240422]|uniref:Uncharacterized protein n=1 Tax=Colletotrichum orbiculare (strain 104-T / ATCC 96160 / CBS 514.97 / LARS 414 / MAFF 240422) TaxID=1213857 RepID=A0A484FYA3_COLOR|nr:hypothetical protein Cob_v004462 [Colletotrichum orbiculare MAFF 240422]
MLRLSRLWTLNPIPLPHNSEPSPKPPRQVVGRITQVPSIHPPPPPSSSCASLSLFFPRSSTQSSRPDLFPNLIRTTAHHLRVPVPSSMTLRLSPYITPYPRTIAETTGIRNGQPYNGILDFALSGRPNRRHARA